MKNVKKILISFLALWLLISPITTLAFYKDETIYTNLRCDGSVKGTLVNNHIYNFDDDNNVNDDSEIKELLNISGAKEYTVNNSNISWESVKKDLYYQGLVKKELPVNVKITYYLNDKKVNPRKILGKKGKIKINLKFSNNSYDPQSNVYTPFVVTLGTMISNKNNHNISITNGKISNTGNNSMVVALAAPGLYDSLKINEFKTMDEVQLSYETTNFSLNNIYMISTPKLLSNADLAIFDKMSSLNSSLNFLENNMTKIVDGVNKLADGSEKIAYGANIIYDKLNIALEEVKKINIDSSKITDGVKIIGTSLEDVKKILTESDKVVSLVTVKELEETNKKAITDLENKNNELLPLYNEYNLGSYECINDLIVELKNQGKTDEEIKDIVACKETYELNVRLIKLLNLNTNVINNLNNILIKTIDGIDVVLNHIDYIVTEDENGLNQIDIFLTNTRKGIDKASDVLDNLHSGINDISTGSRTLAVSLNDINNQGIVNKFVNYKNEFITFGDKAKSLAMLSKNYNGYVTDSANNSLFIYKIESLSK